MCRILKVKYNYFRDTDIDDLRWIRVRNDAST